jgi:hypothetical protein
VKLAAIVVIAEDPLAVVAAVHDAVARFIGPLLCCLRRMRDIAIPPPWSVSLRLFAGLGFFS